jgi:hypothetical protein
MLQYRHFGARWLLGWAILAAFLAHQSFAQSHPGFPVDIIVGPAPSR